MLMNYPKIGCRLTTMLKDDALILDGLDEAIAGQSDCGRLIYDHNKMLAIFMERDKMTQDEAVEWSDYTVMGVQPNGAGFIMMYEHFD